MKLVLLTATVLTSLTGAALAEPLSQTVEFRLHVADGLSEQDVFVETAAGAETVTRATEATSQDAALFAAADAVKHNPFDTATDGPHAKGADLGITLGEWLLAEGTATVTCDGEQGSLRAEFTGLVPDGVYTMWHYFMVLPPTEPFVGTYDLPVGARDGSEAGFVADASGRAIYDVSISPCLQVSGETLASGIAIAWHSDGETHGVEPGAFGKNAHVQLYAGLPAYAGY